MTTQTVDRTDVAAPLRRWAFGLPAHEAAVEFLLRACDGRLVDPSTPWIRLDDGCLWLDPDRFDPIPDDLSEPERRIVVIVDALASGRPIGHLADRLAELDQPTLRLVLAAFAHAGSRHTVRLAPLISWSEP